MAHLPTPNVTELLVAWSDGDEAALERLMPLVYAELRRLARRRLARERGRSLQTTALVHEAYLRLIDQRSVRWQNRAHFFAISARLMRRILIDHARARQTGRRGQGAVPLSLDTVAEVSSERASRLVELDEALNRLAAVDARKSQVVELRFFGGLSVEETAEGMDLSPATVKRYWSFARAWLARRMSSATDRCP